MHELAITQGIVNFAIDEAVKRNAAKVTSLNICVGALSGMVPDCIETYFALIAEGTIAEGANLIFRRISAKVRCMDCGSVRELPDFRLRCPECASRKVELLSGREAYIESMEIEEKE